MVGQPTSSPARMASSTNPVPGKEDHAADGVVGEPGMSSHREASGQDESTGVGLVNHRSEQSVLGPGNPILPASEPVEVEASQNRRR